MIKINIEKMQRIIAFITLELFFVTSILPHQLFAGEQQAKNNLPGARPDQTGPVNRERQENPLSFQDWAQANNSPSAARGPNIRFSFAAMKNALVVEADRARVTGEQPVIIQYKDVKLHIPAGAVKEPVEIKIETLNAINKLNPGMDNVTASVPGYRFLPHGMKFEKNILLIMPYDRHKVTSEQDLASLSSFFYHDELKKWEKLPRVSLDREKGLIGSLTNHFTDMINSVLKLPQTPGPLGFNPTSIKNLEAADPYAAIPQINGLNASSQGAAQFNLPLRLPPGRNGMMPALAINYHSETQNGWLGKGFNLTIPAITIDTRFGLPQYDGNDQYLLNGSQLVKYKEKGPEIHYRLRLENRFLQIIRQGNTASDYVFKVTDKNGTLSIYGAEDARLDGGKGIFTWYLKSMTDKNGNQMSYYYQPHSIGEGHIYLSRIEYSGHKSGESGVYRVEFENEERRDVIINCRGKFYSEQNQRLKAIRVLFKNQLIRSYTITYRPDNESNFAKSEIQAITELDKNNTAFYSYQFDYYDMPEVEGGYAGFQPAVQWANSSTMSETKQSDSGGSFYGGIGLFHSMFTMGVNCGNNKGHSLGKKSLIDVNGDGLPDLVSKNSRSGDLVFRQNLGHAFDPQVQRLSGLKAYLSQSESHGFSRSVAGGIGPFGANKGKRTSFTEANTILSDVNKDGFVDVVVKDSNTYYLNMLSQGLPEFQAAAWGKGGTQNTGVADDDLSELKEAFHLLDPVIKWKPYHSGTITIVNHDIIKQDNQADQESDGIKLNLYKNNVSLWNNMEGRNSQWQAQYKDDPQQLATSIFLKEGEIFEANAPQNTIGGIEMERSKDAIYFKVNSVNHIIDDAVTWNPMIYYEQIRLHDDMAEFFYALPDKIKKSDKDHFLSSVNLSSAYTAHYINQNGSQTIDYYEKKQSIKEQAANQLRQQMLDQGYFLPKQISFQELKPILQASSLAQAEIELLVQSYKINPLRQRAELLPDLSMQQKSSLRTVLLKAGLNFSPYYWYSYLNQSHMIRSSSKGLYIEKVFQKNAAPTFLTENNAGTAQIFDRTYNRLLLDIFERQDQTMTKTWLNIDGPSTLSLTLVNEKDQATTFTQSDPELTWTENDTEIVISLDQGVKTNVKEYRLQKDKENVPQRFPVSYYVRLFSATIPDQLTLEQYQQAASIDEGVILSAYVLDGDIYRYQFKNDEQLKIKLLDILAVVDSIPLHYRLDLQDQNYFTLQEELDKFQKAMLLLKLKDFRVFKGLKKQVKIFQDRLYVTQLEDHAPASAEAEVAFKALEPQTNTTATSLARLESMNQSGKSIEQAQYLHVFHLTADFHLTDLNTVPDWIPKPELSGNENPNNEFNMDQIAQLRAGQEPFNGGVYNWFYGEWNGNQTVWNTAKLTEPVNSHCNNSSDILNDNTAIEYANHFMAMQSRLPGAKIDQSKLPPPANDTTGNDPSKDLELLEQHAVYSMGLWHGSEIMYIEQIPSDDPGRDFDPAARYFTSYISGTTLCPSRKGGDSLYKIPRKGGPISLQKMGNIRFSSEKCKIWGVAFGAMGESFFESKSKCEKDFMDINGDGFPDQLISNDGNIQSILSQKTDEAGIGFINVKNMPGAFSNIRQTVSDFDGKGITAGSAGTTLKLKYGPKGNPTTLSLDMPAIGMSRSESKGQSITDIDLFDINGDGLPDHVRRTDSGAFEVRLNLGDSFAPARQWITPGLENFENCKNIRYSQIKSAGDAASAGLGSAYCAVGYNVTIKSLSENLTLVDMADINGDRLMDYLYSDDKFIYVSINKGNGFLPPQKWCPYSSWDTQAAMARNLLNDTHFAELKETGTTRIVLNRADLDQLDLNQLKAGLTTMVRANFEPEENPKAISYQYTKGGGSSYYTYGVDVGFNKYITVPLGFVIIVIVITAKPSLNKSRSVTRGSLKLTDINGDGLPDHVYRHNDDDYFRVKLNQSCGVGLLKQITSPTGSLINLAYTRVGNTVAMPQSKYVLCQVNRYDGFEKDEQAQPKIYQSSYEYKDGYYDRTERTFYGFGEVIETNSDGSYLVRKYHNKSFYKKGLLYTEAFHDNTDKIWSRTDFTYDLTAHLADSSFVQGVFYVPLLSKTNSEYDRSGHKMESIRRFEYDRFGNITKMIDEAGSGSFDDIIMEIDYTYQTNGRYIVNQPDFMRIIDAQGNLLREKSAVYDPVNGNLLKHHQKRIDAVNQINDTITTSFQYDRYGNIQQVQKPGGYFINYEYDYDYQADCYRIKTTDRAGYSSQLIIDYTTGQMKSSTDMSGSSISREYDSFGRVVKVWTDYDIYQAGLPEATGAAAASAHHAVEYIYFHTEQPARAVTKNKIYPDPGRLDCLSTITICDGFGRLIQSKKEGVVRLAGQSAPQSGMNVSGKKIYDGMGRIVKEAQPVFQPGGYQDQYYDQGEILRPTLTVYDPFGRVIKKVLPGQSETGGPSVIEMDYEFENNLLKLTITDPNGRQKKSYKDVRNQLVKEESFNRDQNGSWQTLTTTYQYSILGELIRIRDNQNHQTKMTYDSLGQCTSINHPDSGLIVNTYDQAGNLIFKQDSNLRNLSRKIAYQYDQCNRLVKTIYPNMAPVLYTYGSPGAGFGRAGRLAKIEDQSGETQFTYGKLGEQIEVIKNLKCSVFPQGKSFKTAYQYDYLGKVQSIAYPDTYDRTANPPLVRKGETIYYEYDEGGQVNKVSGFFSDINQSVAYVNMIHYDEFGQRKYIQYGNGVETNYTYDQNRHWLTQLQTKMARKNGQTSQYQNLDYQFDKAGNIIQISNDVLSTFGRKTEQKFTYDDLYQLVTARGESLKASNQERDQYQQSYIYDDIGNLLRKNSQQSTSAGQAREGLNYQLQFHYTASHAYQIKRSGEVGYQYDANGNVVKKYRYVEGGNSAPKEDTEPIEGDPNSANEAFGFQWGSSGPGNEQLIAEYEWDDENRLKKVVSSSNTVEMVYNALGQRAIKRVENESETLYVNKMYQLETQSYRMSITKHVFVGTNRIATRVTYEDLDNNSETEKQNTFYYHPDHLGSTNLITDRYGDCYEYFEYTPYGEIWIEEGDSSKTNFITHQFTGKELDERTGLYYYGARYYDPRLSRWLSCDPQRQHLNPYLFCRNNPLKYTDPDGNADHVADEALEAYRGEEEKYKKMEKVINKAEIATKVLDFDIPDNAITDKLGLSKFKGKKVIDIITGNQYQKFIDRGGAKSFGKTVKFYGIVALSMAGIGALAYLAYSSLPEGAKDILKKGITVGDAESEYGKWTFGGKEIISLDHKSKDVNFSMHLSLKKGLKYQAGLSKSSKLEFGAEWGGGFIKGIYTTDQDNEHSLGAKISWDGTVNINLEIDLTQ